MKKDLLIAGVLVVVAALGVGLIAVLPALQKEDEQPKTTKPKTEPIAELPKKPVAPRLADADKDDPLRLAWNQKRKPREIKKPEETKIVAKAEPEKKGPDPMREPEKLPAPKAEVKVEPKVEVKVEKNKEDNKRPIAKVIDFDPLFKLNDPDGEYTVKPLHRGKQIKLIGTIKTLKIAGLSENSEIDASDLVAEEVIFLQDVNHSKVILGKTKKLTLRDINDKSVVDASAAEASVIVLAGAINSRSTVKLHAPKGTVEIIGPVNDHSQVEIVAPEGKVLFKNQGSAINEGKVTIVAKEVEMRGPIYGSQTLLNVTLTKDGSLKFLRLDGQARLQWHKADAGDPPPRIDAGEVGNRAQFRMAPTLKK